jgi:hypothetical protein
MARARVLESSSDTNVALDFLGDALDVRIGQFISYGRILDASSISHYEKGTNVRCGESRKLAAPGGDMRNR